MPTDQQPPIQAADQHTATTVPQNAATKLGNVLQQGLGGITRRIASQTQGHRAAQPSRERLMTLITALGDAQHTLHAGAVDLLVEIGTPAVPALIYALNPQRPWLTVYRAAEALGRIGDARAAGALIEVTRKHPNTNVRWSAIRALAQMSDVRASWELRRIAHDDHGRTSWGDSLSETAQALQEQSYGHSMWAQTLELIKTAITAVLMILALILAFGVSGALQQEFTRIGQVSANTTAVPQPLTRTTPTRGTSSPTIGSTPVAGVDGPTAGPAPTPYPTIDINSPDPKPLIGSVLQDSNVRASPDTDLPPVGRLSQGDEIVFISRSPDGQWFRVRLGERHADGSVITNPDNSETGWINRSLVSDPGRDIPAEAAP